MALLLGALRQIAMGLLWAIGAHIAETLINSHKPFVKLIMSKLLFHPKITLTAGLMALASFCTLIVSIAHPLHDVPYIGNHAKEIVATAACVGPLALWIATFGRSPASSVDNNKPHEV